MVAARGRPRRRSRRASSPAPCRDPPARSPCARTAARRARTAAWRFRPAPRAWRSSLRRQVVRARRLERGREQRRLDLRDHLPLLHGRVEVDVDLLDAARHLRADLDRHQRRQRSGRGHLRDDRAAIDRDRLVARRRARGDALAPLPDAERAAATTHRPSTIQRGFFMRVVAIGPGSSRRSYAVFCAQYQCRPPFGAPAPPVYFRGRMPIRRRQFLGWSAAAAAAITLRDGSARAPPNRPRASPSSRRASSGAPPPRPTRSRARPPPTARARRSGTCSAGSRARSGRTTAATSPATTTTATRKTSRS